MTALCLAASTVSAERIVRAGIYQNDPKIFLDENQKPSGFFVELLEIIAKAQGWDVQYQPCKWVECLERLERGDLDLMADVAFTSAREARFDFGREVVFASWSVVYARPNSSIESIVDLDGKKIAVLRDSVQHQVLEQLARNFAVSPRFIEVTSFEAGFELVEKGEADCVAVNRFYGKRQEATYSARPTSILLAPALVKFAAPKRDDGALLAAIDMHLEALKRDSNSAYHAAFHRWLEPTEHVWLPQPLKWLLAGIGALVIVLALSTLAFRGMVRRKTLELEQSKGYLEQLSYYDSVTGLPNRVLFIDRLEHAARHTRRGAPQLGVLFVDLDEFKQINDSVGHEVGDQVLKQVAERFTACVRREDTVARLGGDEFTVLIECPGNPEHAATVAEKLIDALRKPFQVADHSFYLSASVGISLLPQDGTDAATLLRNADAAMYRAKEAGRSTVRFYTQDMTTRAVERISLVTGLREALERDEIFVHYQPLYSLGEQRIVGIEALARWKHGDRGLIPPDKFIPLAEESGVIFALGERILRDACTQMVEWRRAGLAPGRVAVNLSGRQIQRGDIVEFVRTILNETGCRASWLELEVTENFVMSTPELTVPAMEALRALGVEIAIDDFGTGHSSLANLKKLPISKLKIDRSFVDDIPADRNDTAIAQAVIALGESLGLTVLAEGIETEEQHRFLTEAGCNEGQGYLFSRPLPAAEVTALLMSNASADGDSRAAAEGT